MAISVESGCTMRAKKYPPRLLLRTYLLWLLNIYTDWVRKVLVGYRYQCERYIKLSAAEFSGVLYFCSHLRENYYFILNRNLVPD